MILNDHLPPSSDNPVQPASPRPDPCVLLVLRQLESRTGAIGENLLHNTWPQASTCKVKESVASARSGGYITDVATGILLSEKGRELLASLTAV